MGAPGTHHVSVFTAPASFTGASAWYFRGISAEDAKLLCLWFNSSLFLAQVAERRAQTEGTWWYVNKHGFARTKVPDLRSLTPEQRRILLELFDRLRSIEFPSLLEQLRTSFEGRRSLDLAWLATLGIPEDARDRFTGTLHTNLYDALSTLVAGMGKD